MDELHSHRSFTDSGSHAFYRTVPHIAYLEKPGNICLQQKRISIEGPPLGTLPVSYQVGTSQDDPAFVPSENVGQPVGSRQRSNKDEHCARRHAFHFVCIRTKE